jgi:hypothetical protein
MKLRNHPIAEIFPMIEGTEFDDLVADIKANGLHEPIVTYKGQILDGRNRYKACCLAGVEAKYTEYTGTDPAGYVISANLHRRHLTASQRAVIAERLATAKRGGVQSANMHIAQAAKQCAVSPRLVHTARQIRKTYPEKLNDVVNGKKTLNAVSAKPKITVNPVELKQRTSRKENIVLNDISDAIARTTVFMRGVYHRYGRDTLYREFGQDIIELSVILKNISNPADPEANYIFMPIGPQPPDIKEPTAKELIKYLDDVQSGSMTKPVQQLTRKINPRPIITLKKEAI